MGFIAGYRVCKGKIVTLSYRVFKTCLTECIYLNVMHMTAGAYVMTGLVTGLNDCKMTIFYEKILHDKNVYFNPYTNHGENYAKALLKSQ